MGIRAETGNYQGLSSIYEHFPKLNPHKQGRIENYQEFRYAYVGVTFGVRCNLDTLDCPPNKTSKGIIETEIIKNFFTNVPPKKGKNFHKHIIASK